MLPYLSNRSRLTSSHPHASLPGMDVSYNENSQVQRQAFEHFWPWLEDAVTHSSNMVPFRQSQLISYADFGCSGGRNSSMHFCKIKSVLEKAGFLGGVSATTVLLVSCTNSCRSSCTTSACTMYANCICLYLLNLRWGPGYRYLFLSTDRRVSDQYLFRYQLEIALSFVVLLHYQFTLLSYSQDTSSQLQVTLVDVPSNDWNKVADTFFKPGAVGCAGNILPSLVPKSFYAGEVAPAGSLHIGISVDALQWLSHAPPVSLKDSITYVDGGILLCLLLCKTCRVQDKVAFVQQLSCVVVCSGVHIGLQH